jgi:hypothetical protein
MSSISFSTKPQKKYYSYTSDGCVYSISSSDPERIADKGGVWYCYFKYTPYAKIEEKTYLLYIKNGKEYEEAPSFYNGETYYYQESSTVYTEYDLKTKGYYTKNGATHYDCPQSAAELPRVQYKYEDETVVTYYFDTLIATGDKYVNGVFSAMDVDGKTGSNTTYGSILLDKVKDSISLNSFITGVANLPIYLTGTDKTKDYEFNITDTDVYTVPANYLTVYGKLFVEKLNEYMKEYGDAMIAKYIDSATATLKITDNVTDDGVGTLITAKVTEYSASKVKRVKKTTEE